MNKNLLGIPVVVILFIFVVVVAIVGPLGYIGFSILHDIQVIDQKINQREVLPSSVEASNSAVIEASKSARPVPKPVPTPSPKPQPV